MSRQPTQVRFGQRVAGRILRLAWPGQEALAILGDLDEEYACYALSQRGRLGANLWYWRQVLLSLPHALRKRLSLRPAGPPIPNRPRPRGNSMDTLLQDLRYAFRGIVHRPTLSLVILATLTLGIGVGTAIFSVVRGVVLEPLPYAHSSELLRFMPDSLFPVDKRTALYLQQHSQRIEIAAWGRSLFALTGQGEPEDLRGLRVFSNHFSMLGAKPLLGRTFQPQDGQPGAPPVVILSHSLWTRKFGADPAVVGRTILIRNVATQVVGIMGPLHQPMEEDCLIWAPSVNVADEGARHMAMAANVRLLDSASPEQAQDELRRLLTQSWAADGYQATEHDVAQMTVVPLRDWILGDHEKRLLALLGAVGFVLLIVCANVANLLLAQSGAREREMAVRLALGARRGRLVRQLLTESGLLGLAGGAGGILLSAWAVRAGAAYLPEQIPRTHNIAIDGWVLAFGLAVSMLCALLFGLAPAWRSTGRGIVGRINAGSTRLTTSAGRMRLNRFLIAAEAALSVVLAVGAGLMLRSLWQLEHIDPGFEAGQVVTLRPAPPASGYPQAHNVEEYFRQVDEAVLALPGVSSIGRIQFLPMMPGGWWSGFRRADRPLTPGESPPSASARIVSPGYFPTMRIPLLQGRNFGPQDDAQSPAVVIVNQAMAKLLWGEEDPVGRELLQGSGQEPQRLRVVGVAGDVRQSDLRTASVPEAYFPLAQRSWRRMHLAVRVEGEPHAMASAVRETVRSVDPQVPLSSVRVMKEAVGATIADSRFLGALLTAFGLLALLLGAVGVYGVMSNLVTQRRQEMGIRIALGAASHRLLRTTIARGLVPVAVGIIAGAACALAFSRLLTSALFEISAADPATFLSVPLLLLAVAAMACYLPARRASRVDPILVLRGD